MLALGLLAAGAITLGAAGCSSGDEDPTATEAAASATAEPTESATEAGGPTVQAPIAGFTLPTLTVAVGSTVVWSNQDGVTHTATADDGEFDSGTITDGTFSHTFASAGSFAYACQVHPTMTGEIVVE
jgi:plastocyanin